MEAQIDIYRQKLLQAGFEEATMRPYHFLKHLTEKTAFVINPKILDDGIGILYGVMSTAVYYSEQEKNFLKVWGTDDNGCNLRFYSEIKSLSDEVAVKNAVSELYEEYKVIDKDTLLEHVKVRRKQFMSQITDYLKPLGFIKRGNQWNKSLTEDMTLQLCLDKIPYQDLYSFEVFVFFEAKKNVRCCYGFQGIEITKQPIIFDFKDYAASEEKFDWQLLPSEEFIETLKQVYEQYLVPFTENTLQYLGEQPFVQNSCHCSRDLCENCWIKKNAWGE